MRNHLPGEVGMPSEEPSQETQQVAEVDFKARQVRNITVTPDSKPAKFLRDAATLAKKGIKSVMVMTVSDEDHVDYKFELASEHHMALMALTLDDAKDDLKAYIFKEEGE
jgi:hypothetical protein